MDNTESKILIATSAMPNNEQDGVITTNTQKGSSEAMKSNNISAVAASFTLKEGKGIEVILEAISSNIKLVFLLTKHADKIGLLDNSISHEVEAIASSKAIEDIVATINDRISKTEEACGEMKINGKTTAVKMNYMPNVKLLQVTIGKDTKRFKIEGDKFAPAWIRDEDGFKYIEHAIMREIMCTEGVIISMLQKILPQHGIEVIDARKVK